MLYNYAVDDDYIDSLYNVK